ncbi:YihY/virulence factor BrkB family protein [Methylobacterium terricola]|uniref:YihY/virulence factor BrkB family protein n=1 Tax=Methylobacterium terricola TaxID=2583531 RepID=A0A5C4LDD4_9HYPH|nr:YihY/virulence factor BrkB family protein [Methylobacterium terricola]TNC10410.1 YihY/virulence factor BrkB family protein [Methylobacterium terricola]
MRQDDDGEDWRSRSTRPHDDISLARTIRRAREPDRGRTAARPEQIPARGWLDILARVFWSMPQDRVLATAGGVSFFTLLAAFPGIATVVSLYGLLSDPRAISQHLTLLTGILPAGVLALLTDEMTRIAQKSTGALSSASVVSFLIAFWSANSGVMYLFDALNVIYKEREKRTLLQLYSTSLLFTFSGIVFVVAAIGIVVVLPVVLGEVGLGPLADTVLRVARWPLLLIVVGAGLSLIYRYGPSRREAKWRWVTWGAVLAALLWVCTSVLFSWYVSSFDSYNRTYGSLGAGVGFMTWMWLSVAIVLIGAELNSELERQTALDSTTGRPRPLGSRDAYAADTVGPAQPGNP